MTPCFISSTSTFHLCSSSASDYKHQVKLVSYTRRVDYYKKNQKHFGFKFYLKSCYTVVHNQLITTCYPTCTMIIVSNNEFAAYILRKLHERHSISPNFMRYYKAIKSLFEAKKLFICFSGTANNTFKPPYQKCLFHSQYLN